VDVPLEPLIWVKVPTAYMVPPQSTSLRIVSVVPVATSVGVPASGLGDTLPVWASTGTAGTDKAVTVTPVTTMAPAISALRAPRSARGRA